MSALPIFDETRGEFVPATPAPAPTAKCAPAVERAPPVAARPNVRVQPTGERDDRLSVFQACLARVKRELDGGGKTPDAQTIGELIGFLNSPEAAKALADERDHQPIYAVGAAFIDVLAIVSDESI